MMIILCRPQDRRVWPRRNENDATHDDKLMATRNSNNNNNNNNSDFMTTCSCSIHLDCWSLYFYYHNHLNNINNNNDGETHICRCSLLFIAVAAAAGYSFTCNGSHQADKLKRRRRRRRRDRGKRARGRRRRCFVKQVDDEHGPLPPLKPTTSSCRKRKCDLRRFVPVVTLASFVKKQAKHQEGTNKSQKLDAVGAYATLVHFLMGAAAAVHSSKQARGKLPLPPFLFTIETRAAAAGLPFVLKTTNRLVASIVSKLLQNYKPHVKIKFYYDDEKINLCQRLLDSVVFIKEIEFIFYQLQEQQQQHKLLFSVAKTSQLLVVNACESQQDDDNRLSFRITGSAVLLFGAPASISKCKSQVMIDVLQLQQRLFACQRQFARALANDNDNNNNLLAACTSTTSHHRPPKQRRAVALSKLAHARPTCVAAELCADQLVCAVTCERRAHLATSSSSSSSSQVQLVAAVAAAAIAATMLALDRALLLKCKKLSSFQNLQEHFCCCRLSFCSPPPTTTTKAASDKQRHVAVVVVVVVGKLKLAYSKATRFSNAAATSRKIINQAIRSNCWQNFFTSTTTTRKEENISHKHLPARKQMTRHHQMTILMLKTILMLTLFAQTTRMITKQVVCLNSTTTTTSESSQQFMTHRMTSQNNSLLITYDDQDTKQRDELLINFLNNTSDNNNETTNEKETTNNISYKHRYNWPVISLIAFMFIGATGNILVCMAVLRERSLQSATNYFLLSLAIADLLVCTLVMPFGIIYEFYGHWPFDWRTCNLWVTCDVLTCSSSILHMCFISVGRYLGIRNPLHARQANLFVSRRAVLWRIAIAWASSALIASPITMMSLYDHKNIIPRPSVCSIENKYFLIFGSLIAFFIPMFVMVPSYVMTVRLLSQRAKFVRNDSILMANNSSSKLSTANATNTTSSEDDHQQQQLQLQLQKKTLNRHLSVQSCKSFSHWRQARNNRRHNSDKWRPQAATVGSSGSKQQRKQFWNALISEPPRPPPAASKMATTTTTSTPPLNGETVQKFIDDDDTLRCTEVVVFKTCETAPASTCLCAPAITTTGESNQLIVREKKRAAPSERLQVKFQEINSNHDDDDSMIVKQTPLPPALPRVLLSDTTRLVAGETAAGNIATKTATVTATTIKPTQVAATTSSRCCACCCCRAARCRRCNLSGAYATPNAKVASCALEQGRTTTNGLVVVVEATSSCRRGRRELNISSKREPTTTTLASGLNETTLLTTSDVAATLSSSSSSSSSLSTLCNEEKSIKQKQQRNRQCAATTSCDDDHDEWPQLNLLDNNNTTTTLLSIQNQTTTTTTTNKSNGTTQTTHSNKQEDKTSDYSNETTTQQQQQQQQQPVRRRKNDNSPLSSRTKRAHCLSHNQSVVVCRTTNKHDDDDASVSHQLSSGGKQTTSSLELTTTRTNNSPHAGGVQIRAGHYSNSKQPNHDTLACRVCLDFRQRRRRRKQQHQQYQNGTVGNNLTSSNKCTLCAAKIASRGERNKTPELKLNQMIGGDEQAAKISGNEDDDTQALKQRPATSLGLEIESTEAADRQQQQQQNNCVNKGTKSTLANGNAQVPSQQLSITGEEEKIKLDKADVRRKWPALANKLLPKRNQLTLLSNNNNNNGTLIVSSKPAPVRKCFDVMTNETLATTPLPQMTRYLGSSVQVRSEQKATKVLGVVFFAFVFCWSPFFIINFTQGFVGRDTLALWISDQLMTTFLWLGYISSTINPVIYTVFNRNFRRAFRRLVLCREPVSSRRRQYSCRARHSMANTSEHNKSFRFSQYRRQPLLANSNQQHSFVGSSSIVLPQQQQQQRTDSSEQVSSSFFEVTRRACENLAPHSKQQEQQRNKETLARDATGDNQATTSMLSLDESQLRLTQNNSLGSLTKQAQALHKLNDNDKHASPGSPLEQSSSKFTRVLSTALRSSAASGSPTFSATP